MADTRDASGTGEVTSDGVTLSGEDLIRVKNEAINLKEQIKLITEAIENGKGSLDTYIAKAKLISEQFVEAKINAKGFYEGVSIANEKLKEEINILDTVTSTLENEYKKAMQETTAAFVDRKKILESLGELESELGKDQTAAIEELENRITLEKIRVENLRELLSKTETVEDAEAALLQLREAENKLNESEESLKKRLNVVRVQEYDQIIANSEAKAKELAQLMSENNLRKLQSESIEKTSKSVAGLTDGMFGASTQANVFTSAFIAMSDKSKTFSNTLGAISESFLKPENAMNRFFNFLNKNLIQSTFEFDKTLSQVNKTTGGFRQEFEQVGMRMGGSAAGALATYGVSLEKLGQAYASLSSKINGFNRMSDDQRKTLTENAATMENLGVSMDTYASIASNLMGAVGKTAEGARNTIDKLAKDAIAAGRNVGEYVKEFEQIMPKLAAYGRDATQIFKEINAIAAMTKGVMSAGDLDAFASQFDNWDSAAESVSKLNLALGGASVNIVDLMKADPSEKLMMIKRAFDESGQDWDKLNAGYKRMLAESFGGDVAKAAAFFKGSLAEANAQMQEAAATEEELAERKKQSVDAQEKLTKAIDGMKLSLTPIITIIASVAEGIAGLNNAIGPFGTFLTVALPLGFLALRGGFKLLSGIAKASLGEVTTIVKAELDAVIAKAGEARVAVNSINTPIGGPGVAAAVPGAAVAPPVTSGAPDVTPDGKPGSSWKGAAQTAAITAGIGVALMGISALASSGQSGNASNANYLVNKPAEQEAVKTDDADFSSTRPIVTFDDSNRPVVLANTNNRDRFATVRATTPESRAKEKSILQSSIVTQQNNSLSSETANNMLSQHVEKFYSETEKRMDQQKQVIEKMTNYQPIIKINATAGLDPKAAEALNERAVAEALGKSQQAPNLKVQSSLPPLDTRIA